MTAILKVDTIQDVDGNNIINENAGTITIGKSGDTVNLAAGSSLTSPGLTLSDNILFNTANKGIYLGVTTATASNLLDDYEEGTFTPTVTGATSGSFTTGDSAATGSYVKIGNQVTVRGEIHITGSSSPVGALTVGNLPFANSFLTELSERTTGNCWVKYMDLESTARNVVPFITQGNSYFQFYETNDNANVTAINSSEVTVPGAEFAFCLTYQTA